MNIIPQQKTFKFKKDASPEDIDKTINKWSEDQAKKNEHCAPHAPGIKELSDGSLLMTFWFLRSIK